MWRILEARAINKELSKAPQEVLDAYAAWKNIVATSGPSGLRKINGYWDHALKGEWAGARASSLSKQWRIIYLIRGEAIEVLVLIISPHDYRR